MKMSFSRIARAEKTVFKKGSHNGQWGQIGRRSIEPIQGKGEDESSSSVVDQLRQRSRFGGLQDRVWIVLGV